MNRPARSALLAVAALAASAAVAAAAVTPPAGTPDLGAMEIQASDLQPGATLTGDGYAAPSKGFVAKYVRVFSAAQATPGGQRFSLDSELDLAPSATVATRTVALERSVYGSKLGHTLIANAIIKAAHAHGAISKRNIRFAKLATVPGVPGAFLIALTVHVKKRIVSADIVGLAGGPVVGTLTVLGIGLEVKPSIADGLATTLGARIASVLATGSTGSTGSTGATGATGTTGTT